MKSILKLVLVSFIVASFSAHATDGDIGTYKSSIAVAVAQKSYNCKRIFGFNRLNHTLPRTMSELVTNTDEFSVAFEEGQKVIVFKGENDRSKVVYTVVASLNEPLVKSILTQKFKKVEGDENWKYLSYESICTVK